MRWGENQASVWRLMLKTRSSRSVHFSRRLGIRRTIPSGVSFRAAAHLGSTSLAALALAGRVEARDPRVLAAAAVAWSWPIAAGADWEL